MWGNRLNAHLGSLDTRTLVLIGGVSGIAGPLVAICADVTSVLLHHSYSPIQDSMSLLSLAPWGWIQSTGFALLGASLLLWIPAMALGLRETNVRWRWAPLVLFGFIVVCLYLMAFFHTAPTDAPRTLQESVHIGAAVTTFAAFPLACIMFARIMALLPRWKALSWYTTVTGIAGIALIIGRLRLPSEWAWFGLHERVMVLNAAVWLIIVSIRLLRDRTSEHDEVRVM